MVQQKTVSRRAVAKGVAWSAPVIVASSAVPAYAASPCVKRILSVMFLEGGKALASDASGTSIQFSVTGLSSVANGSASIPAGEVAVEISGLPTSVEAVAFTLGSIDHGSNGAGQWDSVTLAPAPPKTNVQANRASYDEATGMIQAPAGKSSGGSAAVTISNSQTIMLSGQVFGDGVTISKMTITACL